MTAGRGAEQGGEAALLGPLRDSLAHLAGQPVGIAVSGGSDSLALLCLTAQLARDLGLGLRAVTVDHRLRPEAAAEAAFVAPFEYASMVLALWGHGWPGIVSVLFAAALQAAYCAGLAVVITPAVSAAVAAVPGRG